MRQPSTAVFLPVVTATLHTVGTLCCKGTKPRLIVGAAQVNVFPSKGVHLTRILKVKPASNRTSPIVKGAGPSSPERSYSCFRGSLKLPFYPDEPGIGTNCCEAAGSSERTSDYSCRTTLRREESTWRPPLYLMIPVF